MKSFYCIEANLFPFAIDSYIFLFFFTPQQRHVSDSQVNNRKSKTFRNGKLVNEKWSGVQVSKMLACV